MSLINDALKRAKQSQQPQPRVAPLPMPAAPPVEVAHGPSWFLPVAVILLVAVACLFLAFAFFIAKKPAMPMTSARPTTPPAAAPTVPKTPSSPTVLVAPVVPPKPLPPALKVQGIFYNDAKWQAVVNGQAVFVGDSVNGFHVKAIARNDVSFITPDGTEKTMTLGE